MKDTIYKLAVECKEIDNQIEVKHTKVYDTSVVYDDYTIKGDIKKYESALLKLRGSIQIKYPFLYTKLKEYMDGYSSCSVLKLGAIGNIVETIVSLEEPKNTKKIFISHSSKDKEVIGNFVDKILGLGIGISHDDIFCTSIEDMAIKNGEDIRKHIQKNIRNADFSFLMISDNYKNSEICINEMGAVWAYNCNVRYYLLPEVNFDKIGWLCDTKKANKLNDTIALDALQKELITYYSLLDKGISWSRQREGFLEYFKIIKTIDSINRKL